MKKLFFFLLVFLGAGLHFIFAQNTEKYWKEAAEKAVLYRGPTYIKYPFRYNGTFYAFSDVFVKGELYYNHKYYNDILLNLNANRDELYVKLQNSAMLIIMDKNLVEKFKLGDREFWNITDASSFKNITPGYYQVIYNGEDKLFKKIEKKYYERLELATKDGVFRSFDYYQSYMVVKDGVAYTIGSPGAFAKIYKGKKNEIKKFIKTNNLKFVENNEYDSCFRKIMQFIDEN